MPQIQGGKGEAVVVYREPLTTQEMRYPRLSRRVNNMAIFLILWISFIVESTELLEKVANEDYYCFS
ncbi:MAG: hypothetical protein IMF18_07905 [Proteobacteria bacterium]|nr:hypothetical protein [Pseudomonadota bacterium]